MGDRQKLAVGTAVAHKDKEIAAPNAAIKGKKQVVLKGYESADSDDIKM